MADQDGRRLEIMAIVAALLFLELKRVLKGEGGGGGGGLWSPRPVPVGQKKPGLDRANLPFMFYSHCHLISRTLKEKLRPTKDL